MPTYTPQITVQAETAEAAVRFAQALATVAKNIELSNLETLALKSNKPGINQRIKQYASFI